MAGGGAAEAGCSSAEAAVACEALRLLRIDPSAVGPGVEREGGAARCSVGCGGTGRDGPSSPQLRSGSSPPPRRGVRLGGGSRP